MVVFLFGAGVEEDPGEWQCRPGTSDSSLALVIP